MNFVYLISAICLTLLGWCEATATQLPIPATSFWECKYKRAPGRLYLEKQRISLAEFKKLCDERGVYVLDLRDQSDYDAGHIRGALYAGSYLTDERLQQLVPDTKAKIILYWKSTFVPRSPMILDIYAGGSIISDLQHPHNFISTDLNSWGDRLLRYESNHLMFGPLWVDGKITAENPTGPSQAN